MSSVPTGLETDIFLTPDAKVIFIVETETHGIDEYYKAVSDIVIEVVIVVSLSLRLSSKHKK
jgi:hypothetical protein